MKDIFNYRINDKELSFYPPTHWTIAITKRIREKLNIKNKVDLSKYILYYSQADYKIRNHIPLKYFNELSFEILNVLFCEYLLTDKKFIEENNIYNILNLYDGTAEVIKYIEWTDKQLALIMITVALEFSIETSWMKAIQGQFFEEDVDRIKISMNKYKSGVLHELELLFDYDEMYKKIEEFAESYPDTFFDHLYKISLAIFRIKKLALWIPSRFVNEIWKKIVSTEMNDFDDTMIQNTILDHFDDYTLIEIERSWCQQKVLCKKEKIIREFFQNIKHNLYYSVVIIGLTIIDDLVYNIVCFDSPCKDFSYTRNPLIEKMLKKIESIKGETTVSNFYPIDDKFSNGLKILQLITLTNYLKKEIFNYNGFDNIKDSDENLNRHGIMHGKLSKFGNKGNAYRIIILIDDLLGFHNNYIKKKQ